MTRFVGNFGMGADSMAMFLRWANEPRLRPCALEDLLVITAQTGDEWTKTGRLVQQFAVPLFRELGIRWVQVARHGPKQEYGYTVLEDSRHTRKVHLDGDYKLSQEMISNGTIPQVGGPRKCSLKAKGFPIDTCLKDEMQGEDYIQFIGFELGETGRAVRDTRWNTEYRTGAYPLIEWKWDRADCEKYIYDNWGVWWPKSCCTFCPYALQSSDGRRRTLAGFEEDPETGVHGLLMEHLAVSLNHKQGLNAGQRLANLLAFEPSQQRTMALFRQQLDEVPWSVYEVQRAIVRNSKGNPRFVRNLNVLATAARAEAEEALQKLASAEGLSLRAEDGIPRAWIHERAETQLPTSDWLYVAAPEGADAKKGPGFDDAWAEALTGSTLAGSVLC